MKDVPKYVVVVPQDDGSLYPIKFHSEYDEAVITANNHDASSSKKAQIRSDGPEVWKQFEAQEQKKSEVSPRTKLESDDDLNVDEMNKILNEDSSGTNDDNPSTLDMIKEAQKKFLVNPEKKLVEFAEKLEKKMAMIPVVDPTDSMPNAYVYEHAPVREIRPFGLLFWGPRDARVFSIRVNNEEQLANAPGPGIYINSFMNPYGTIEQVLYWVEKRVKLQYTNLALPTIPLGSKISVMLDKACTVCVVGVRYE